MKKFLLVTLITTALPLCAQKDNFWLYGKLRDSSSVVKNVNVINLKTKKGTFSNDFGDYKIIVSIGDTLQFSSVQHETIYRTVSNFTYQSEILNVFMVAKTYELKEVRLKRNDLDGFLTLDFKKKPNDRKADALKKTMDFSKVDMDAVYNGDYIDQRVRPPLNNVDPIAMFVGAGVGIHIPFKFSEKLWQLRKNLQFKRDFPDMLLSEFGAFFFESELKIPLEKLYNFLEYCNPLGIEDLFKQNRKLELIAILTEQSANYLSTQEN